MRFKETDLKGIAQGGPVVVLWGELIAGVGQSAIALCLSEMCRST